MLDILFVIVILTFILLGMSKPSILLMGYVWIDIVNPQGISYGFLDGKPISMIMASFLLLSVILNKDKIGRPKSLFLSFMLVVFALWITITTNNAYFPDVAWHKWNWAFKTLLFCSMIPFVIKSKTQLEYFLLTIIFSLSSLIIPSGIKTLLGGGGYGKALVFGAGNSGAYESSTLAALSVAIIPLIFYFYNRSALILQEQQFKLILLCLAGASVLSIIGGGSRTGLVGLCVLMLFYLIKSKHRVRCVLLILIVCTILSTFVVNEQWSNRMTTIQSYDTESSALGRIVVWKWTLDFVKENPMGGGFLAYLANRGELNKYSEDTNFHGFNAPKAFHSIYFEVLGEQGYFGLLIFLIIIFYSIYTLFQLSVSGDSAISNFSSSLLMCLVALCICSAFIGIAFQPYIYYFCMSSVVLKSLVLDGREHA